MRFPRHDNTPDSSGTGAGARRRRLLTEASLYVCTDARSDTGDLREFLHAAYDGGVDIIQLRDKHIDTRDEIAALEVLAEVAAEHDALFAVNDRADIAALVGADVFHIGQDDLTVAQARALLGPDVVIGLSTHSLAQATAAVQDADVDYFCTGPVWETPTKPGRAATGLELVTETAAVSDKVFFTIGGVNAGTLPQVLEAGGRRAVVVRAVTDADDPRAAASELEGMLRSR